jgi:hypothetical protein
MEQINRYRIEVAADDVATATLVSEQDVRGILSDGRGASPWVRKWCEKIGNLEATGAWDSTGADVTGANVAIAVKTLTKQGVRFQDSIYIGGGRSCSPADLMESLNRHELFIVGDTTKAPTFVITPVHSKYLRKEASAGRLTPSGWTAADFERFVRGYYQTRLVVIDRAYLDAL